MASGEIHFSGLASGVDTDSILEKIMYLERRPLTMIQEKSADCTAQKSVISALNSKISTLQSTLAKMTDVSLPFFSQKAASSTQTSVATVLVSSSTPAEGSYCLTVNQLATAAILGSQEALYTGSDRDAQPATLTSAAGVNATAMALDPALALNLQAGALETPVSASGVIIINGTEISWDESQSLNQIMANINNAGLGVTAAFDPASQRLSLVSHATGASADMTTSQTSGNFWEAMKITPGVASGTDAVVPDWSAALGAPEAHLDRAVTAGTFTVNGVIFSVDPAVDSLNSVLARINASSAGVTAVYNNTTGAVSLQQKETGAANQIVLGASGDTSNLLWALKLSSNNPPTGGADDRVSGSDASVSMNGGPARSFASNSFDALIPGVRVDLQATGTTTVKVGTDIGGIASSVAILVDQYNDVMNYINTKTREVRLDNPATAQERIQGSFTADLTFLETKASMTSIVSAAVAGLPSTMNQLAQIGITTSADNFGKDATLALDETKLRAALGDDPDAVANMLNGTDGILTKLKDKLKALTDPVYGGLTLEKKYYDAEISSLDANAADMEERLAKRELTLKMQFSAMETALSQLQSQSNTLSEMLSKLG